MRCRFFFFIVFKVLMIRCSLVTSVSGLFQYKIFFVLISFFLFWELDKLIILRYCKIRKNIKIGGVCSHFSRYSYNESLVSLGSAWPLLVSVDFAVFGVMSGHAMYPNISENQFFVGSVSHG